MNAAFAPVLVSAIILVFAFIFAFVLPEQIRRHGEPGRWIHLLSPEIQIGQDFALPAAPEAQKVRLNEQIRHIRNRADHHFQIMSYFYSNYYTALLLGGILGGLAAISLMWISKNGWNESNACLVSFCLTTSVCTTFFVAFPKFCKHEENVARNKLLYLKYVSLLNNIRTYAAIKDCAGAGGISDFIKYLDAEMEKANDIAVSFDPGKYPIYKLTHTCPIEPPHS